MTLPPGTVAAVTGASSGIGAATARALAAEGVGDAVARMVTRPARVAVNELLLRPPAQP